MSTQYPHYPQYGGQPQYDPYNQPQVQQAQQPAQQLPGTKPPEEKGDAPIFPKLPDPADQDFWDKGFLAAVGGIAGEVRLTSDAIVDKAAACAERMVETRKAYIKGEMQGQVANQKAAAEKQEAEKKAKEQQEQLKGELQKKAQEEKAKEDQLKKQLEAQLAPLPPGLDATIPPPASGAVSDWIASRQKPPQPPAAY